MSELKQGDKVIYLGSSQEQCNWGNYTGDWNTLKEGKTYTVEKVEPHHWHTKLFLKEVKGNFNSICFKLVVENETRL